MVAATAALTTAQRRTRNQGRPHVAKKGEQRGQVKLRPSRFSQRSASSAVANEEVPPTVSRLGQHLRQSVPPVIACGVGCGGRACKYESAAAWPEDAQALKGIFSHWVTDDILAMARPNTLQIKEHKLYEQFQRNGIKSLLNLQETGEHEHCGFGLTSCGLSYFPQDFMDAGILCYQYGWKDFGTPNMKTLFNMVYVIDFALQTGKIAVHCHAGLGRTGMVIACYLIYGKCMGINEAIKLVRHRRPGSIQNQDQLDIVYAFGKCINETRTIFTRWDTVSAEGFSAEEHLKHERFLQHGLERRQKQLVPRILTKLIQLLLDPIKRNVGDELQAPSTVPASPLPRSPPISSSLLTPQPKARRRSGSLSGPNIPKAAQCVSRCISQSAAGRRSPSFSPGAHGQRPASRLSSSGRAASPKSPILLPGLLVGPPLPRGSPGASPLPGASPAGSPLPGTSLPASPLPKLSAATSPRILLLSGPQTPPPAIELGPNRPDPNRVATSPSRSGKSPTEAGQSPRVRSPSPSNRASGSSTPIKQRGPLSPTIIKGTTDKRPSPLALHDDSTGSADKEAARLARPKSWTATQMLNIMVGSTFSKGTMTSEKLQAIMVSVNENRTWKLLEQESNPIIIWRLMVIWLESLQDAPLAALRTTPFPIEEYSACQIGVCDKLVELCGEVNVAVVTCVIDFLVKVTRLSKHLDKKQKQDKILLALASFFVHGTNSLEMFGHTKRSACYMYGLVILHESTDAVREVVRLLYKERSAMEVPDDPTADVGLETYFTPVPYKEA
eukprot:scpid27621/ scgid14137/ Protein tyrosine phosphatase domain-containing protein 1